jgi:hypothetical protein
LMFSHPLSNLLGERYLIYNVLFQHLICISFFKRSMNQDSRIYQVPR